MSAGEKFERYGWVCPECRCLKDSYDTESHHTPEVRWCWNVKSHKSGGCRRMLDALFIVEPLR